MMRWADPAVAFVSPDFVENILPVQVAVDADRIEIDADELTFSVGAGVSVAELERACTDAGVILPFEPAYEDPPEFSACRPAVAWPQPIAEAVSMDNRTTMGGLLGVGLSGSRRPWGGALRDAILGVDVLGADGQPRHFGGRVLKNVAGFDIARLMVGSFGTLGAITAIHGKLLPVPRIEVSCSAEMDIDDFIEHAHRLRRTAFPISGLGWWNRRTHLRLSGGPRDVEIALEAIHKPGGGVQYSSGGIGGAPSQLPECQSRADVSHTSEVTSERHANLASSLWRLPPEKRISPATSEHAPDGASGTSEPTWWRIALPPATRHKPLASLSPDPDWVLEWGGGLRFVRTDADATEVRERVSALQGIATIWSGAGSSDARRLHPRSTARAALERRVRKAFDPFELFWSPVYDFEARA
ncbi:MAG: hypothetical protein ACK4IT_01720 [Thioalkalivibrionaceae bacterium]